MAPDDTDWVVLAEHTPWWANTGIDDVGMQLIFIEQVLLDNGIDVHFDPVRPGEGGGAWASDFRQPVRLMVPASELDRAREIAQVAQASQEDTL